MCSCPYCLFFTYLFLLLQVSFPFPVTCYVDLVSTDNWMLTSSKFVVFRSVSCISDGLRFTVFHSLHQHRKLVIFFEPIRIRTAVIKVSTCLRSCGTYKTNAQFCFPSYSVEVCQVTPCFLPFWEVLSFVSHYECKNNMG